MTDLGTDSTALDRWAADARVDDAAQRRARRRWLDQQLREESSLRGLLVDVAEARKVVTITASDQRRSTGRVHTVGADYVALHGDDGVVVVIALAAVRLVTATAGAPTGERAPVVRQHLHALLFDWAAERPEVVLRVRDVDEPVRGELQSVGVDVLSLIGASTDRASMFVPLDSVIAVAGVVSVL